MKILLVEDEEPLSKVVAKGLIKLGFAVDQAYDGEEALFYYEVNCYDLIVLDLNIPIIDGMEVLRTIRKKDMEAKILILSARSEINERVLGLNEGANDYLVKPFDFEELTARIHNLVRRAFVQSPSILTIGGVSINLLSKEATVNGARLALTNKEYAILEYMMLHQNRVISNEEIIEHIWDSSVDLFSNSLKFHLHSLKKKLANADIIANVRGQGYIIRGGNFVE